MHCLVRGKLPSRSFSRRTQHALGEFTASVLESHEKSCGYSRRGAFPQTVPVTSRCVASQECSAAMWYVQAFMGCWLADRRNVFVSRIRLTPKKHNMLSHQQVAADWCLPTRKLY